MFPSLVTGQTVGSGSLSLTFITDVLYIPVCHLLVLPQASRVTEIVFANIALKLYVEMKRYLVHDDLFLLARVVMAEITVIPPPLLLQPHQPGQSRVQPSLLYMRIKSLFLQYNFLIFSSITRF